MCFSCSGHKNSQQKLWLMTDRAFGSGYQVSVFVFAHQSAFDPLLDCGVILADRADVDEEACFGVDPPGVDDIHLVFNAADGVVRVDLKKIVPLRRPTWE